LEQVQMNQPTLGQHVLSPGTKQVTIEVAGVAVRLEFGSGSETIFQGVRDFLGPSPLSQAEANIVFLVKPGDVIPPTTRPVRASGYGTEIRGSRESSLVLSSQNTIGEWTERGGTLTYRPGAHPRSVCPNLSVMIVEAVSRVGFAAYHGALFVSGNSGTLVVGPSGAGKSSTSAAAVAAGFQLGADDMVFVRPDEDWLYARGLQRAPMFPAEMLAESAGTHTADLDFRGRRRDTKIQLSNRWVKLSSVLVVGHGVAPTSRIEPIAAVKVAQAILGANVASDSSSSTDAVGIETVRRLAALSTHKLALGTEDDFRLESTILAIRSVVD
jgi:hypothetical protein